MVKRKNIGPPTVGTFRDINDPPLPDPEDLNLSSDSVEEVEITQDDSKTVESKATRKKRSEAWDHFTVIEERGKPKRAKCNYCDVTYLAESSGYGTKNMKRHMTKCRNFPSRKGPMNNYTLSYDGAPEGEGENLMKLQKFDPKAIREAIVDWVICEEIPFRCVESEYFKKIFHITEPRFQMPSRITIARDVFKRYLGEKVKLKEALNGTIGQVSLTTDMWTSSNNASYMCITAHFIDKNWKLHNRIISFRMTDDYGHGGESIGKQLERVTKEWGIQKIMCITVDNAQANEGAVDFMKKYGTLHLLGGDCIHVRCFAHILNLLVKFGLQKCDPSIERIRNAVKYIKASPKRQHKFIACVQAVGIEYTQGLRQDVVTRWNSIFLMLEAAEKYELAFDRMADEDVGYSTSVRPGKVDWENARKLLQFLRPFYDATTLLSGTSYVTIHQYFSQFCAIRSHLNDHILSMDRLLQNVAFEMSIKYNEYFGNVLKVNMFVYVALVFDPRTKLELVKRGLDRAFANDGYGCANDLFEKTRTLVQKLFDEYSSSFGTPAAPTSKSGSTSTITETTTSSSSSESRTKRPRIAGLWDIVCDPTEYLAMDSKSELDTYLGEARETPTDDFDLLGWWRRQEVRFHILSAIARDIFAIPASTVASESAFSTGGRVITDRRSSLLPRTVEALICTQSWMKNVIAIESEEVLLDDETAEMVENAAAEEMDGASTSVI